MGQNFSFILSSDFYKAHLLDNCFYCQNQLLKVKSFPANFNAISIINDCLQMWALFMRVSYICKFFFFSINLFVYPCGNISYFNLCSFLIVFAI